MSVADQRRLWQDIDAPDGAFRWHIPERFNIGTACCDQQAHGDLALVVDDGSAAAQRFTFGALVERSNRLVTVLRDLGVAPGDRVGVMAPQGLEVAIAHLACYKTGAVVVPMSTQFGPEAMVYRLAHSGARTLVISAEGWSRLADSCARIPELESVLIAGAPGGAAGKRAGKPPQILDLLTHVDTAEPAVDPVDTAAIDPALLIYTSGTTGPPKGVLHRHQVLLAQMPGLRISHDGFPEPDDVFWTPADWAWAGGLFDTLLVSWLCGRPVVASPRKFDPAWAYELMSRHRVRNCFLPPTALKQMRQAGPPPAGVRLRTIASGGEPLGESILSWAGEHLGVVVKEFYGQTEANLMVGNGEGHCSVRPGSMGRPYPGFELTLRDADGHRVADGEEGEIALRLPHPGAFVEYWREPERTAEKMHDGRLFTGDLARRDADGSLFFAGRADDIISSGGYRIGPGEIEECLISHPDVPMAAVIGVPDELRGEAVAAYVVPAEGVAADEAMTAALQDHVKHRLAFYQYPRRITYVDELPMTTTGKIQRGELRRRATMEQR
jgi:acetyl-CoA synthetase